MKILNVLKANDRFDAVTVSYVETIVLFVKRDIATADRVLVVPFSRARALARIRSNISKDALFVQ